MATQTIARTIDRPRDDSSETSVPYPSIPTTCDGAENVVWVETRISQGSGAFPITSSTTMGGGFDSAAAAGTPNLWGDQLVFVEPESEHSSATFCEGFRAGRRTSHQLHVGAGLVLMKGKFSTRLPASDCRWSSTSALGRLPATV